MSNDGINPNNNVIKQEDIINLWYLATGEKFGKVNLAINQEVSDAVLASKEEYMRMVNEKAIPVVYQDPITVRDDQNIHLAFVANTHYFDISNPQLGAQNGTNYVAFKEDLLDKAPRDYTIAFFAGNLIGKEWRISDLNNASIDENKKILFWGLQSRLNQLVSDIIFAAQNGADQIFLMNGREEHMAKRKLNVDVLREVLVQRFNDLVFNYVVNILKNDNTIKAKKVKIAYVSGVKKVFNIVRINKDKTTSNFTFSMHTNLKTTSTVLASNKKAAIKQHAGLAMADAVFIQGENASGVLDDDANVVMMTGQSTYNNSSSGNLPGFSPKGRSQVTLLLGKESHDVELAWTMNFVDERTYYIERKMAEFREKSKFLAELCQEKIAELQQEFVQTQGELIFDAVQQQFGQSEVEDDETK